MKYLMLIRAGVWRKPARTILTALSIVVAFLLFGILQGFSQSLGTSASAHVSHRLWTSSRVSQNFSIPMKHLETIRRVPGVKEVTHVVFFSGYFQTPKAQIGAWATDVAANAVVYPELNITPEHIRAMRETRTGALVGRALANQYGWKVGDRVPLVTTLWTNTEGSNDWVFDIVGIFDSTPEMDRSPLLKTILETALWFNYDYFDSTRRFSKGRTFEAIVRVDDAQRAAAISTEIDALFANSGEEVRTQPENAALQAQLKQVADLDFIVRAVVGAVLFALLFLTANSMMQALRERTSELAVLRALGYSQRLIFALVLLEALVVCVIAAGVGLLLASGVVRGVGGAIGITGMPPTVLVTGFGLAALLAIVSGGPPAWRAQRMSVVAGLAAR